MIKHGNIEILALVTDPSPGRFPLGPVFLPLSPGVSALYGLNGAGKSLILESLREVLTGKRGERTLLMNAMLYVRPEASAVDFSDDMEDLHVCGLAAGLYEELSPRGDSLADLASFFTPEEKFPAWEALSRWRSLAVEQFEFSGGFFDGTPIDQILIEFLKQKRFLIRTSGTDSASEWLLDLALIRDPEVSASLPYLDLCDKGIWKDPEIGELAIRRAARAVGGVEDVHNFWPTLYRLEAWGDWNVADLRLRVMGGRDFDPDDAVRNTLDSFGQFGFEYLLKGIKESDSPDESDGFLATAARVARGEVPALTPLTEASWLVLEQDHLTHDCGISWFARFLSWRANSYFSRLLPDAPELALELGSPREWAIGRLPRWGAIRGQWIPLHYLSTAELRWATIAIELALASQHGGFLLLDEPELALHRSAEQFMARGLSEIADERGLTVVVASHSPELLNDPRSNVFLVRRSDQGLLHDQQVHALGEISKIDLREFGLLPSDLLRRQRGFLFVEGQHDLVVLESLLGDELRKLRVEVLPMRGAGRLSSVLDSRVLYDFTDAHFFILLDALRLDEITQIWNESVRLAKTGVLSEAVMFADQSLKALKLDEANALSAFLTRALERGLDSRHTPLGLSLPDILDYLPASSFVPGAESWNHLRLELAGSTGQMPSGTKFKTWLTSAKRADLSPEHIKEVCGELDHVPDDLVRVLQRIIFVLDSSHA